METNSTKGSLWRIWDLHVHTPAAEGGSVEEFIEAAKTCKADVIGINDYCTLDGYDQIMRKGEIPGKVLFPVVEFRMHNLLQTRKNPNGVLINFHIIFDNAPEVFPKIKTWLASLECFDERGKTTQLGTMTDRSKVSFDYKGVIASLKELELYDKHALVWLPYDEYGGIDEIDPVHDGYFKLALINDAHIIGTSTKKQIEFFKWLDPKHSLHQYESWFDKPKPCIKGSDAHRVSYPFGCLQNEHSQPIDKYCWINADMTFQGLRQIVTEPDRVFIGEEPPLLQRIKGNRTKFIRSLSVSKTSESTTEDVWFDHFSIELNGGLVAIIGNKGGGKSAITDILSLCGNTHQSPSNFSFLTKEKFRRVKPQNLSSQFKARLVWEDGISTEKLLSDNPQTDAPERVKYIPQNFLERLCTEIDSDLFERELKSIIFSHTPQDERLGKTSLDELINYKSDLVNQEIDQIKNELGKVNVRIVELELKASAGYKSTIENNVKLKEGELAALDQDKPVAPETSAESEQGSPTAMLTQLRENIKSLEESIGTLQAEKTSLALMREELKRTVQFYSSLREQLIKYLDPQHEYAQVLQKNGIDARDVFSFSVNTAEISTLEQRCSERISAIDFELSVSREDSKSAQLKKLTEDLRVAMEELDRPAKAQQKYLDDLKAWNAKKAEIEGNAETEGTLNFLREQLNYLSSRLQADLTAKKNERTALAKSMHEKKLSLVEIRKVLFLPVSTYIDEFHELKQRYDVKIDVALELKTFADSFFGYIAQNKIGTYAGREEGYKRVQELIERSSFTTSADFIAFVEDLMISLGRDLRSSGMPAVDIQSQLKKGMELNRLYDFLYSGDYLQPTYYLKLGNKTLQELSPGERGALLLIFYLILDNDDMPLIIDQPEENLDNESVYHILVHFIKRVKERRQIVIVTHNPNLAVVCDADQIIHMHIEKDHKNTIRFVAGSIENPSINRSIINVLEGTLPAFNNRDAKYLKKTVNPLVVLSTAVTNNSAAEVPGEA